MVDMAEKRRSPVETGDLNDCLPYEKKVRNLLCRCLCSFDFHSGVTRCSHSQCNITTPKCLLQANFGCIWWCQTNTKRL